MEESKKEQKVKAGCEKLRKVLVIILSFVGIFGFRLLVRQSEQIKAKNKFDMMVNWESNNCVSVDEAKVFIEKVELDKEFVKVVTN